LKAALRDRYGPPEVVNVQDVERPVPSDDQVLVRVHAASVNRADLDGLGPRPGFARLFMGFRAPRNLGVGLDVAGLLLGWKPFNAEDVAALKQLIAAGRLKPAIDRRFPLSEVVDALRWVDDGHAKGKVIVTM
jgi:NADPH:quinone reductase-like Zn-dependent oxidoreductase